jgi:hypothetical protein
MGCKHGKEIQFVLLKADGYTNPSSYFFTVHRQEPILIKMITKLPGTLVPVCHLWVNYGLKKY